MGPEQGTKNLKRSPIKWIKEAGIEIWHNLLRLAQKITLTNHKDNPKTFWPITIVVILLLVVFSLRWLGSLSNTGEAGGRAEASAIDSLLPDDCQKFDIKDWQTGQGALVSENGVWSVASSSPNGLLRYFKAIPLTSIIKTVFVPRSEKEINFVFNAHDLYEIVIGDGSFQGVTLKASQGDGRPMKIIRNTDGYKRNIFGEGGLAPGIDTTVVLNQTLSPLENGSYEVNIRILYRSESGSDKEKLFASYDFPLPPKLKYGDLKMRFSLGLIKSNDATKVGAEILCFDVR